MENSKKLLRQRAKDIRGAILFKDRETGSALLQEKVMTVLKPLIGVKNRKKIIGTYYPIGSEIQPPRAIDDVMMALPVIRHKIMIEFYPWTADMRLVKRDFDIPIPDTRGLNPVHPDILLIPLLLCDERGNRIGYGAGHYDRYIASCVQKPLLIGLCYEEQVWPETLPYDPYDQRLDLIITPKRIIEVP